MDFVATTCNRVTLETPNAIQFRGPYRHLVATPRGASLRRPIEFGRPARDPCDC